MFCRSSIKVTGILFNRLDRWLWCNLWFLCPKKFMREVYLNRQKLSYSWTMKPYIPEGESIPNHFWFNYKPFGSR